ncbi:MAG TPA: hypothetical protein PLD32_09240, partial [Saprospiraceae bacterium]|nr:hypothetical protein [Saprospiraceae bacterium]
MAQGEKIDTNLLIKGLLILGGGLLGLKIINTVLQGLGLKKTDDEIQIDNAIKENYSGALEAFNPEYYLQAKASGKTIRDISAESQQIVKSSIYNCIGYVYDNPQKCLAA